MSRRPSAASGKPTVITVGAFSATIYFTPAQGRPRYTLAWADPSRGRVRETFTEFDAAKLRAEEVARSLQEGDTAAAGFRGPERARFAAILQTLEPTGLSAEVAAAQFAEAFRILGGRSVIEAAREYALRHRLDLPTVTVPAAVATFLEDRKTAGSSKRYLQDLQTRLVHGFAADNAVNLADLTADRIREWLIQAGGGPRHHNNNLATLKTLIRFCIGRRWLPKDTELLDGITKRKVDAGAIEIWTPEEMALLLRQCPPVALPAMAISAFAGLRNAEVARLEWKDVHLAEGFIEVSAAKAKTASRRLAPCPPNLVEWLSQCAERTGPIWPHHNNTTHNAFREAARRADLQWRENALRHSFVSYRLADLQDVARVALEAGNSPAMIFKHYRELVRPADGARWFQIRPDRVSTDADHETLSVEPSANGR